MNLNFLIVQALSGIKRQWTLKGFHIYPKEKVSYNNASGRRLNQKSFSYFVTPQFPNL